MGLAAILDAVEQRITEVIGLAGEKQPSFAFGESERPRGDTPPRIVWIPRHGRRNTDAVTRGRNEARTLMLRSMVVEARVWHETFEDLEKLVSHLNAALYATAHGAYAYVSEEFDTDGDRALGFFEVFTFQLLVPLRDEPLDTTQPTTAPLEGTIETEVP